MATRTLEALASLLDDRIDILERDVTKYSPAKQIFGTISAILALTRVSSLALMHSWTLSPHRLLDQDRINGYKETVQLSDYCFDVCEALKATIQEETKDDLGEFAATAIGDVGRYLSCTLACLPPFLKSNYSVICEIEQTLKTATSLPHVGYDKAEIEGKKLKIQDKLDALNRHSSSSNGDDSLDGRSLQSPFLGSHDALITPVSENGRNWPRIRRSDMER